MDKVALITGGVRGIGRAIALALSERGWAIATCYRASEEDAASLNKALAAKGVRAISERADVSDARQAEAFVRMVENEFGHIDALINGAGPYHRVNLLEETVDGWNEMINGNLNSAFYVSRAVIPGMKERRSGRIINFSMANADKGEAQPFVTGHYIAKSGLLILTRTLAKLLAPFNITVNAISPGFIDSGSASADELQKMLKTIPAGYLGSVEDCVSAALYLLSEEARYINGGNIHLSGGWGM
ncbi:MAG: SDR family oxidoreductase [Acidobacteriota bacterium]